MTKKNFFITILFLIVVLTSYGQVNFLEKAGSNPLNTNFNIPSTIKYSKDSVLMSPDDYIGYINHALELMNSQQFNESLWFLKKAKNIYKSNKGNSSQTWSFRSDKNPYVDYYIGINFDALGNYDSAAYHLRLSLEEVPYFVDAYNSIGNVFLQTGSLDSALYYFTKGLKINDKLDVLNHNIGYVYFLMSKPGLSRKFLKKNIEMNPGFFPSFQLLGMMEESLKKHVQAQKIYSEMIQLNPNSIEALETRAFFYLRTQNLKGAKADLFKIIQLSPEKSPETLFPSFMLASIDIYESNYYEGTIKLGRVMKEYDAFNVNLLKKNNVYLESEIFLILDKISKEKFTKDEIELVGFLIKESSIDKSVKKTLIRSYQLLKENPDSEIGKRICLYAQVASNPKFSNVELLDEVIEKYNPLSARYLKAKILYDQEKYDECIIEYSILIKDDPDKASSFYRLGLSLSYTDQQFEAIEAFTKAIKLEPDHLYAYNERGKIYKDLNYNQEAIRDFKKALTINDLNGWPYNSIGLCFGKMNMLDSALYYYNKAIEVNPRLDAPFTNRGKIYFDKRDYDKALDDYNSALSNNPKNHLAINRRGELYNKIGEVDKALQDFTHCIILNPKSYYYTDRADVYIDLEDYDKAMLDFKNALLLNKNSDYSYKRIGDCFKYLSRFDSAIVYYHKAIAIDKDYKYAVNGIAYSFLNIQSYDSAIVYFKKSNRYRS